MSAYLVVLVSVLAAATATLTLNLLARLDWRQARAWTRPAATDTPIDAEGLLEPRQGPCGCLTVTGAIALLHEQGYVPFGQLGSGGELLANGEAAAAVWPAPPERIAAVQFGTLSLGPAHQQPASHLDAAALQAAGHTHRATLADHPTTDPTAQPEVFELVYPLLDPPPAQHPAPQPRHRTVHGAGDRASGRAARPGVVSQDPLHILEHQFDQARAMSAWDANDPTFRRPLAAPLEQCVQLLGVDLATLRTVAADVEPYLRVDGTKVWSLMQLERRLRPDAYGRGRGGYVSRRRSRTRRA